MKIFAIIEEARRRYPVGTTYVSLGGSTIEYTVEQQNFNVFDRPCSPILFGESGKGILYQEGNWARIISRPSKGKTINVEDLHYPCVIHIENAKQHEKLYPMHILSQYSIIDKYYLVGCIGSSPHLQSYENGEYKIYEYKDIIFSTRVAPKQDSGDRYFHGMLNKTFSQYNRHPDVILLQEVEIPNQIIVI